jgi:hypothetical protein
MALPGDGVAADCAAERGAKALLDKEILTVGGLQALLASSTTKPRLAVAGGSSD